MNKNCCADGERYSHSAGAQLTTTLVVGLPLLCGRADRKHFDHSEERWLLRRRRVYTLYLNMKKAVQHTV